MKFELICCVDRLPVIKISQMQGRILVVEDDKMLRQTIELLLSYKGYIVKTRSTGRNLIKTVAEFSPGLILLDIILDGLNGRDLCRELKSHELYHHIPIIVMSANDDVYNSICADGANDVILKPFDERTLLSRIERQLVQL